MSTRKSTQKKTATTQRSAKPATTSAPAAGKNETAVVKMPVQNKVSADVQQKQPLMKKRELVDRVVERTGVKKGVTRQVVEAFLAEFGDALASGRELSVPPLGRIMINREKEIPDGRVFVVKIRQKDISVSGPGAAGKKEDETSEE